MQSTIKDVAKKAGVSPSTVTRVIQNSSAISQKTKEIVLKAMKELEYHPNLNARSLAKNCSNVIGLVLPESSDAFFRNPFFSQALRGISQATSESGYAIQIIMGKTEKQRLENLKQTVYGKRVDGLIFLYSQENDPLVKVVTENQFPSLILGKASSPFLSLVDNDNVQASKEATQYFINKGYRHIGFIAGNKELSVSKDRHQGYLQALKENHMPVNEASVVFVKGFLLEESTYEMMSDFTKQPLDAIVTSDSSVAEGVIRYFMEHQKHIPIISFDSLKPKIPITAYVDVQAISLGKAAAETLLKIIQDHKSKTVMCYRQMIPHQIVEL